MLCCNPLRRIRRFAEFEHLVALLPLHMDISHPSSILLPAGVTALVVWRMYTRIKRLVGRQRLSPVRPWLTVIVFPLLLALLGAGTLSHPTSAIGLALGALIGSGLGVYGHRLTKFEQTPEGLFYTPNAHLGIALSLLFIGRLAYRLMQVYVATGSFKTDAGSFASSGPLTLALFGTLAGYYVVYAIGLLRWKFRVRREAAALQQAA